MLAIVIWISGGVAGRRLIGRVGAVLGLAGPVLLVLTVRTLQS